jgi:ferritin-like metal-binding protein YciE
MSSSSSANNNLPKVNVLHLKSLQSKVSSVLSQLVFENDQLQEAYIEGVAKWYEQIRRINNEIRWFNVQAEKIYNDDLNVSARSLEATENEISRVERSLETRLSKDARRLKMKELKELQEVASLLAHKAGAPSLGHGFSSKKIKVENIEEEL